MNYLLRVGRARIERLLERPPAGGFTSAGPAAALRVRTAGHADAAPVLRTHPAYLRDIDERSEIYLKDETDTFLYHWRHTQQVLTATVEYLKERGIPLLVVLIPDQVQHDGALMHDYLVAVGFPLDRYDFEKPQRLLLAWCAQHDVRCLDLLTVFRRETDVRRLYHPDDPHWSRAGHELAARIILPALQRQIEGAGQGPLTLPLHPPVGGEKSEGALAKGS
ncbi:MAG: hypothetical protein AB1555_13920 [Nitrospirota bacterium]